MEERLQIGQNEEFSNRAENLVSEAVKRRVVHLESDGTLLEKCGIVGGVASKVRSVR